jgi:hypothetical protein
MTSKFPARAIVVKKEDKESAALGFIKADLERRAETRHPGEYLLLARSLESPVARALGSLSAELAAAGLAVRVVLTRPASSDSMPAPRPASLNLAEGAARVLCDVRFQEGHEQLVLDGKTVWIGDCMRRDPDRHDAYEFHSRDCETTARWASTSFERMWSMATPLSTTVAADTSTADLEVADPSKLPPQPDSGPTALTRH